MKLFEHPDFDQFVIQTREHLALPGLTEQLIEKDYYVTEVLRVIAESLPEQVIFKGGTSLSKGWGLIQRFSEDVDLFVDPQKFIPILGKNGIDRELKKLRDKVGEHPGLALVPEESKTSGGFGRSDHFRYPQKFGGAAAVRDTVLLESGTASGREPVVDIAIESYIGRFLRERDINIEAEDRDAFSMRVMHFRRTFVEKLFTIHAKVEIFKRDGTPIRTYARHYYDLYQLLQHEEVHRMLASAEYAEIKADYKRVTEASFPRDYFEPPEMSFSSSDALFPSSDLRAAIERDYQAQCSTLCYGGFPLFDDVQDALNSIRLLL